MATHPLALSLHDRRALQMLEVRLRAILPEEYQDSCDTVQPVSMGSAALRYDGDGRVAWHEMWATFCDLAMAGGPPHKGTLLEPASAAEIVAQPERYDDVVGEICRGIAMVTDLVAEPSANPGWIRVDCLGNGMAGWLTRAIVMENVAARCEGATIDLPAGPAFRLEKEIKNVITVIAKTCHYWLGHTSLARQRAIANLLARMAQESPLVEPPRARDDLNAASQELAAAHMAGTIAQETGLQRSDHRYVDWLGVTCPSVRAAIWMMRAMVASNVLARREGTVLFVPINPALDAHGERVARLLAQIHGFAGVRGML